MPRRVFALLLVATAACGPVPTLTFAEDDGGSLAADAARVDASDTVSSDAGDTGAADGAPSLTCPSDPPPDGVARCCGAVACVDRTQTGGHCASCDPCIACNSGEVCCYRADGNLFCRKSVAECK